MRLVTPVCIVIDNDKIAEYIVSLHLILSFVTLTGWVQSPLSELLRPSVSVWRRLNTKMAQQEEDDTMNSSLADADVAAEDSNTG